MRADFRVLLVKLQRGMFPYKYVCLGGKRDRERLEHSADFVLVSTSARPPPCR